MPETSMEYAARTHLKAESAGPYTIQAISGTQIHLDRPQDTDVKASDIAHGLSLTCRFGGQCSKFYSVAEHAVFVRDLVACDPASTQEDVVAALHHDDSEAFLGDVPSPLKPLLGRPWEDLENAWDLRIETMLGLDLGAFHSEIVKKWDEFAVYYEAAHLMPNHGWDWTRDLGLVLPDACQWWGGVDAERARMMYRACVQHEHRLSLS